MAEIFSLNGMYIFFYINNMIHYFFSKDNFYLYSALFHITVCLFFILKYEVTSKIIISRKRLDFIVNLFFRAIAILSSFLFITSEIHIPKLELILLITNLILYSSISLIWLIIHIRFFIKQRRK